MSHPINSQSAPESNEGSRGKIRILLVEDHPIVRHGLQLLIDDEDDLMVCGGTDTAKDALRVIEELKPDVAVVDLTLNDGNGLDLIEKLRASYPSIPVLALSMHDEAVYAERALRAGAKGYIMKKEAMDKLLGAIRRVREGQLSVSDAVASRLVSKLIDPGGNKDATVSSLSEREFQVFRLIADGVGPTEIANRLSLSVKTVETHREHIKEKLSLKTGAELTRFAVRWAMEKQ